MATTNTVQLAGNGVAAGSYVPVGAGGVGVITAQATSWAGGSVQVQLSNDGVNPLPINNATTFSATVGADGFICPTTYVRANVTGSPVGLDVRFIMIDRGQSI